jgi:hypothetical protein
VKEFTLFNNVQPLNMEDVVMTFDVLIRIGLSSKLIQLANIDAIVEQFAAFITGRVFNE